MALLIFIRQYKFILLIEYEKKTEILHRLGSNEDSSHFRAKLTEGFVGDPALKQFRYF